MRSRHIVAAAGLCAVSPTLLAADAAPPRNLYELGSLTRLTVPVA